MTASLLHNTLNSLREYLENHRLEANCQSAYRFGGSVLLKGSQETLQLEGKLDKDFRIRNAAQYSPHLSEPTNTFTSKHACVCAFFGSGLPCSVGDWGWFRGLGCLKCSPGWPPSCKGPLVPTSPMLGLQVEATAQLCFVLFKQNLTVEPRVASKP